MDAIDHLLRRSRLRSLAAAAHRALPFFPTSDDIDRMDAEGRLWERQLLTPDQMDAMQSSAKASAIRAASEAAAAAAAKTAKTTAQTTTAVPTTTATTHSAYVFSDKFAITSTTSTTAITTSSAVKTSTTSTSSSSARVISSSSSSSTSSSSSRSSSSSSTSSSTISTAAAPSSTTTVRTITRQASSSAISSSATPSASVAASNASSTSSGLSTGAIAGIVVAVLVGIVVVGSAIGWLYRKHAKKSNSAQPPWSKIDDDDVAPFRHNEKYGHNDDNDIYGPSSAPVIGSRRALALARQNAFNEDGSYRPDSDYMIERGGNRAGVGSGGATHGAYPDVPSPYYGFDPQGRPYNPHAGRAPMAHMYEDIPADSPQAYGASGNTRQLVGPHGYAQPELSPHDLGRPGAPATNFAIAQHEDFADIPDPLTPTNVDGGDMPYTPRTATTMGEWAGDARAPQDRSRVSMTTPRAPGPVSPNEYIRPPPPAATESFPVAMAMPMPTVGNHSSRAALPTFEPMSPLIADFDLRRNSSQPLAMYEDEKTQQKRLYGEVAQTAGVPEPPTPNSAGGLNDSTSSTQTASSFSAHEPMPRLPSFTLNPPQPYVHGQPLSPLDEMPTPMSTTTRLTDAPGPAGSATHVERNPYERTLLAPTQESPAPPYSATSTTAATAFPSPAYPPPSPGGMSVPGSVTDSPQRWAAARGEGGVPRHSVYDEEDAYGGI